MPSKDPGQRLQDILDNIEALRRFIDGMDFEATTLGEAGRAAEGAHLRGWVHGKHSLDRWSATARPTIHSSSRAAPTAR